MDEAVLDMSGIDPDRDIVTRRILQAPRHIVYKAWSDPVHLAKWWGPKGFTNTFSDFELEPDGKWIFTMHAPDGVGYPNESVFVKIVAHELIVWDHISGHRFRAVASFEDVDPDRTAVAYRMRFDSIDEHRKMKDFIIEKNEENFDKLEAEVKSMMAG